MILLSRTGQGQMTTDLLVFSVPAVRNLYATIVFT